MSLSRAHRSQIGLEEDALGHEIATSVERTYGALVRYAQGGHLNWIGPVDVIKMRAEPAGRGVDGEPIVRPIAEIARYRIIGGDGRSGPTVAQLLRGTRHPMEIRGAIGLAPMEVR